MKIIFLDIDGVVNSMRTALAFGGYPWNVGDRDLKKFDHVALQMIRNICADGDIKIVLSSTWRLHDDIFSDMGSALHLPIIDRTENNDRTRSRGQQIQNWLDEYPEVTAYAILDDEVFDMLPTQKKHIVKTDMYDGLQYKHYKKLRKLFGLPLVRKDTDEESA